jgi:Phytanoyl-CoA dioxygenase (PhyH)
VNADVPSFRENGFAVLRQWFDPALLAEEMRRAFTDGLLPDAPHNRGSAGVEFRVVVMMCEHTPVSLSLLDALAAPAAQLLGRAVIPGRAKGQRYFGETGWHRDTENDFPQMGFVTYLEPVDGETGALQIVPRSHVDPTRSERDAVPVATEPGDVIAFDEHVIHGSRGGTVRHQWRVDFVADPVDAPEEAIVRAEFARVLDPGWDGGDDFDRFPSYGEYWQGLDRPWTGRLRDLGVYDRAAEQAAAIRARRRLQ